jgi:nitrogen-specific signal transduction histidine kinase
MMPRLGTVGMTTRGDGSGLGLSLALQVITQHDGVIPERVRRRREEPGDAAGDAKNEGT